MLAIAAEEPVQLSGRWLAAREPHESIYLGFDAKSGRGDSSCQVQEDGTFATLLPCPGEYSVRAQLFAGSDNLMWFTDVVIPALPEHELELRPPFAWVCGRVLDRDGHPLAAVSVSVREKPWSSTATDAEGRYRLRVAAGTKLMEAGGPRSGNTSRSWAPARTTVEVREGETSENIDFRLDVGGRLRGRVRFPDGTPAADATIRAVSGDESRYFGQCGSDGRFDLDGLESGLLHVSATTMRRTHASPELPVLIRVGETSEVELVLAPR